MAYTVDNNNLISDAHQAYMRDLVLETNQYPSVFKYCNYEGGLKMLSAQNIQFTRADCLNDEDEINISKCDFPHLLGVLKNNQISESLNSQILQAKQFFSGIGICSCGKSPFNEVLWERYGRESKNAPEDGICIELDQSEVQNCLHSKGLATISLLVKYLDNVDNFLPWELVLGNSLEQAIFFQLLYSTKKRDKWEKENEIRFMYSLPFEGEYFRPALSAKCFKSVYYGKDMTNQQRIKIGQILNRFPTIKRYPR